MGINIVYFITLCKDILNNLLLQYIMIFRENLRYILDAKGILIKELSLKTGISENTLKSYLKENAAEPTLSKAYLIANALDVSLDFLATGESKNAASDKNPNIFKINSYIKKFNDKDINVILDMAKALNEKY